jgi:NTP pyrophosphatase (non-canonical NTP hydrolase)
MSTTHKDQKFLFAVRDLPDDQLATILAVRGEHALRAYVCDEFLLERLEIIAKRDGVWLQTQNPGLYVWEGDYEAWAGSTAGGFVQDADDAWHGELRRASVVDLFEFGFELAMPDYALIDEALRAGLSELERVGLTKGLAFEAVSATNLSRSLQWHKGGLEEWSVSDWACAMAGEAGEVCNAVKKLNRIKKEVQQAVGPQSREEAIAAIAKEIGDTFLYLDLLAQRLGISTEQAIRDTFNRVSVREGFPHRL